MVTLVMSMLFWAFEAFGLLCASNGVYNLIALQPTFWEDFAPVGRKSEERLVQLKSSARRDINLGLILIVPSFVCILLLR